ncbi:Longitudinals lacking protein-like [Orchesella cincta]|uniref:Longitudinals lacking protein-like n=1 Tax=Orchesella cincta TaxID=48709 RepID=A0A1D2M1F5_ORCCI|nr:Longitudinals lacking protein-like [Orchesella cincta]
MESKNQYKLRRKDHSNSVLQAIARQLTEERFTDITLSCHGQIIKCHQMILSACSSYFNQIILDMATPNLVICLDEIKFWQLEALVAYMYTGQITMGYGKLKQFINAVAKFKIRGLVKEVKAHLQNLNNRKKVKTMKRGNAVGPGSSQAPNSTGTTPNTQEDPAMRKLVQGKRKRTSEPPGLLKIGSNDNAVARAGVELNAVKKVAKPARNPINQMAHQPHCFLFQKRAQKLSQVELATCQLLQNLVQKRQYQL